MMDRGNLGGNNGMMDRRFNDDNFGFSNEDRRGFALPAYPNDMNGNSQGNGFGGNNNRHGGGMAYHTYY